jgi:predicted nucleic acid-binding protein
MRLLLDTNVLLDYFSNRPRKEYARKILEFSDFKDFEDCLQVECATDYSVDYIITNDLSDFKLSPVKVYTSE